MEPSGTPLTNALDTPPIVHSPYNKTVKWTLRGKELVPDPELYSVLTIVFKGFKAETSPKYIITGVRFNNKGQAYRCHVKPIIKFDHSIQTCYYVSNIDKEIMLLTGRNPVWAVTGDKRPLGYSILFGMDGNDETR